MTRSLPMGKRLVIGVIAVGTVAFGTAGVAVAATSAPASKPAHHFDCSRAPKALARIQAAEAQLAAGLPQLHAAQAKAQHNGNTKRVDRIGKRINRMESPKYKARLEKRKAKIEAACQVSAPAASSTNAASVTA